MQRKMGSNLPRAVAETNKHIICVCTIYMSNEDTWNSGYWLGSSGATTFFYLNAVNNWAATNFLTADMS